MQFVNRAIEHDRKNDLDEAFKCYDTALSYFQLAFKYEKNTKTKEMLQRKIIEYVTRAGKCSSHTDPNRIEVYTSA